MKVKELRECLADLPDGAELLLTVNIGRDDLFTDTIFAEGTRRERRVRQWGDKYQTREVHNAYRVNDDRYGGPVLLIEVGETSF